MDRRAKAINGIPNGFKIIHVLSDGTEIDSVKGMVVPDTSETHMFYEIIAKYN
jgi:hypothetical protein